MNSGFTIAPVNLNAGFEGKVDAYSNKVGASTDDTNGIIKPTFSEVVSETATTFVQSLQNAEATSIAGIKGEATAYEVASSVMEAEQALRTTIAIRDRMVQAYLEISRMQI
jgi:flagellar hook-basal body complex protein FliE